MTAVQSELDQRVGFLLRLARAMHAAGTPAPHLEEVLSDGSDRLGLDGQFFTTPTSIFAAFGPVERQRTHLLRVEPAGNDLGRLAELDVIARGVRAGRLTVAEGSERVDAVVAARDRYPAWLVVLAFGAVSAAGCRFLGGGLAEIEAAGGVGLVVGLFSLAFARLRAPVSLFELSAAFLASLLVSGLAASGYRCAVSTTTLASMLVVVPGLMMTVAMIELANRHLASGTARLSGAFMVFMAVTIGVAIASTLVTALAGPIQSRSVVRPPEWTRYVALGVAPLAFAVLMSARAKDLPAIYAACLVAFFGMQAGQRAFGAELGAAIGSFAVGVATNAYERLRLGPAAVPLTPGVLLLVPGSIGFRSLTALLDENVVAGVDAAFAMLLTAASLAAGILVANLVLPPRRVRRAPG